GDLALGRVQRCPGADTLHLVGHVPGQVLRRRGGHAGDAHGYDRWRRPRAVQDGIARATVSRRRGRPGAIPPARFLPGKPRAARAWAGPARGPSPPQPPPPPPPPPHPPTPTP